MLAAVLSGLLVTLLLVPFGKLIRGRWSVIVSVLPFALFVYFLSYIPSVYSGNSHAESYAWVPSMGLNLDFYLDGLSLLFALLITGIGTLVFLYASPYLQGHPYIDRFYAYLSL